MERIGQILDLILVIPGKILADSNLCKTQLNAKF